MSNHKRAMAATRKANQKARLGPRHELQPVVREAERERPSPALVAWPFGTAKRCDTTRQGIAS